MKGDQNRDCWARYTARYRRGEWRAPIFRDMILGEIRNFARPLTILDIGCGKGFDGDLALQQSLSLASERYIGIEPDMSIPSSDHIHELHRCPFEKAPLSPDSVDLAFATMVLEHIRDPGLFWLRVWEVLRSGGVFWGFTMDGRHFFSKASRGAELLGFKDLYLRLMGGNEHYDNYPVYYRANTPRQIARHTRRFGRSDFVGFSRVGQLDYYVPRWLRPVVHMADRIMIATKQPGSILAIRLQK